MTKDLVEFERQIAEASQGCFGDAKSLTRRAQPPRVSIRGQRFTLVDSEGQQRPVPGDKLQFVVLAIKKPRVRFFYPPPYDPRRPFACYSLDCIQSEPDSPERQTVFCRDCPKKEWTQTSRGESVKPECGEKKQIVVYISGEGAWLMSIPAGSLRLYWDKYVDEIEDVSAQQKQRDGHSTTTLMTLVTEASFVLGKQSILQFRAIGYAKDRLSEYDRAEFIRLFKDQLLLTNLLWGSQKREQQYLKDIGKPLEARPYVPRADSPKLITTEQLNDRASEPPPWEDKPVSRRRAPPSQQKTAEDPLTGTDSGFDFMP
ncbi:MAG: hypothetical protein C5B60_04790 [Chloroflexi bacterium]|nr:MAG: hypothetical protein C5B60_04790 [Chloroflexota bacterium]